ncbi:EI24 domain-containing protein [Paenirhodobacter sp.]|uniref:EI24 domain-containing protein n=1 Tax=Paenirhodobacter sp. TaxID=1965326 RepID=UPI003B50041E
MIFTSIARGWHDLMRPGALKILLKGIGLALGMLIAAGIGLGGLVNLLMPDTVSLPWIGQVNWVHAAAGWTAVGLFLFASVFLMVPVASVFTGFFLEDVAELVERTHYPTLPEVRPLGLIEGLGDTLRFFGVVVAANIVALLVYPFVIPFAPMLFLALNGYLLGREYFQMAAQRRMGRDAARDLYRRNAPVVWMTGAIMALPLAIPVLNLVVPVVGAAAFTHLFHRLARR